MKVAGKQENANEFFRAAQSLGFEFFIVKMVNTAFACELYLKLIAETRKVDFAKTHGLDKLFEKLAEEDKKEIFDIWRENAGENITNCDYTRQMFSDNLEAVANVFIRFRYADEWSGSVLSLEASFTPEQFEKFSIFSTKRPFGSPPIHDGFLTQFAKSLKIYTEKLLGKTYNSF